MPLQPSGSKATQERFDGPGQFGERKGITYVQWMVGVEWGQLKPVGSEEWRPFCYVKADKNATHPYDCGAYRSGDACIICPYKVI